MHTDRVVDVALSSDGRRMMSYSMDGQVQELDIPPPLAGGPEQVRRWVEVLTGLELDAEGAVRKLDAEALRQRRERLGQLGGSLDDPPER
jgi:hypothetical protein